MENKTNRLTLFALFCLALAGCGGSPTPPAADSAWTPALEMLSSPAGGNSSGVQLTVGGDRAILSWIELDAVAILKFAERTSAGWSEPRTIASGEDFFVTDADVPSVRALSDGTLAAHWQRTDGLAEEAYDLPLSWSKDGGRTWSRPTFPHRDEKMVQHGFASLFQAPGGGLGVVWLDGRDLKVGDQRTSMALWSAIYGSDGKQVSERAIDKRVCDCCQTGVATTSDGVILAYRGRTGEEIRDIYVTRFDGREWSAPTPVHDDGWMINGCPVNGPAVDARGREAAVAWFTAKGDQGQAFVAFSSDGGRTFGQPIRIDDAASLGQVDVALLTDGSAVVSWIESGAVRPEFKVRTVQKDGTRSPAVLVADRPGMRNPRLARNGNELLLAWAERAEDGFSSQVRTARAALPAN